MVFPGDPVSNGGHGSAKLSKIGGRTLGVAPKITPVMTVIDSSTYIYENFLDGLSKIYDHAVANVLRGKAVINMSLNFKSRNLNQGWINAFLIIMQKLDDMEVFLVTGSGNSGAATAVDGYPALYRSQLANLVVAGDTDTYGCQYVGSQGGALVEVFAPAYEIAVANSEGGIKPLSDGTYIASATVAGLAAYLQAREGYSQNSFLKERILELQWARPRQQKAESIDQVHKPGAAVGKRQDGAACSSSPPSTGTVSAVKSPITFTSGAPSPSCTASWGTLCDSPNFCVAPCLTDCGNSPNPDFLDPSNPDSPENPNNGDGCQTTIASACQTVSGVVTCLSSLLCKTRPIPTSTAPPLTTSTKPPTIEPTTSTNPTPTTSTPPKTTSTVSPTTPTTPTQPPTTNTPPPTATTAAPTLVTPPASSGTAGMYQIWSENYESEDESYWDWDGFDVYNTKQDFCNANAVWETSGTDSTPPTSFTGMTVFADTCSYTQTNDWSSASTNAVVGYLSCKKYSQATCYKGYGNSDLSECEGVVIVQQIYCEWGAED